MKTTALLSFLLAFTSFSFCLADDLTAVPAKHKLGRQIITNTDVTLIRRRDKWTARAISKMVRERNSMEKTPLVPLEYDGAPRVDIVFKDESLLPGGSHYRSIWILLLKLLKSGTIRKETHIVDGSLGGNSAIAVAHFAKLLGLKATVFVPIEMAPGKLQRITALGASVIRAHVSLLVNRPREVAATVPNGFYLNSPGSFAEVSSFDDPRVNIFDEFINQLATDENITSVDFFVSTLSTGSLLNSVASSASRLNQTTKIVAVDTQFSGIYDYLVNDKFTNASGALVWRPPGIPEAGAGAAAPFVLGDTTSVRKESLDEIIKLPDLAIVAAISVLKEKGIEGGPSTAANFLAALVTAASEMFAAEFTTIVTTIEDSADLYVDTYFNQTWINANFGRHGAPWGYHCWSGVIVESVFTGWNPIETGLDKGCPSR